MDPLKRALKFSGAAESRLFRRAKKELQSLLIIVAREVPDTEGKTAAEVLDLWERSMPKPVRARADQLSEKDAKLSLLSATLNSCVLSREKNVRHWFSWCRDDFGELIQTLVQKRDFLKVQHRKKMWIIPRKVLTWKAPQ